MNEPKGIRAVVRALSTVTLAAALASCGDAPEPPAGPVDAAVRADGTPPVDVADAPSAACTTAAECSDGVFCNGPERCKPDDPRADARGCAPAAAVA